MDGLLPIGRFAKATRLSVKTLRLADHRRMLAFLEQLLDREDVMPYEVTVTTPARSPRPTC